MIVSASSEKSDRKKLHIPEKVSKFRLPSREADSDCRTGLNVSNSVSSKKNVISSCLQSQANGMRPETHQEIKQPREIPKQQIMMRNARGVSNRPSYIYAKNQIMMLPKRWQPIPRSKDSAKARWVSLPQEENKASKHISRVPSRRSSLSCIKERATASELQLDSLMRLKSSNNAPRSCLLSVQAMRSSMVKVAQPAGDLVLLPETTSASLQHLSDHLSLTGSLRKASLVMD